MWKYNISEVSKVVGEKKNEKAPKAAHDATEYEEWQEVNFWACENWHRRAHCDGQFPKWQVLFPNLQIAFNGTFT